MPLTLTLQPELEAWVKQEAAREGVEPGQVVSRAVDAQRFAVASSESLRPSETDLLLAINRGFSEPFWEHFQTLRHGLEAESLTEQERREFTRLYAQVEGKNAERMAYLLQLANIRGVTLPEIRVQLGIGPIQTR